MGEVDNRLLGQSEYSRDDLFELVVRQSMASQLLVDELLHLRGLEEKRQVLLQRIKDAARGGSRYKVPLILKMIEEAGDA